LVSVALQSVLEEAAGREMSIKWPNDILCDERKISGILIEQNWIGGNVQSAIVGIGINVNQVQFEASRAISLKQITGLNHDPLRILHVFMTELEKWYMLAFNGNFDEIRKAYHSALFGKDAERRYVLADGRVISATIEKVDEEGLLHLTSRETGPMKCGLKEIGFLY
jgi:BirA family biotin operon repressor/biotin-[acetyl-CoA-carboxylase] ligase